MPEKEHSKVEICFHRNASLGMCYCESEEWRNLQMGHWTSVMSPYESRYIDLKFKNGISGSLAVSIEEEIQHWRLFCLGIGCLLLLLAPIISNWAPFYYSSSMALGIFLVVLVILFQLGAGSMLVHYFSSFIDSVLVNFGLDEGVHSPVSILVVLGIVITGAAFGYWIVCKFILSEDGSVDRSIAHFVKWAVRVIAIFFFIQSTLDPILAMTAVVTSWRICSFLTSSWEESIIIRKNSLSKKIWQQRVDQATANHRNAEFLSRSDKKNPTFGSVCTPLVRPGSPTKGLLLSYPIQRSRIEQEYFSSFHKLPVRKFSKKEWEDFTRQSTREALAEWASTRQVSDWMADNAHRIKLEPEESSDGSEESSSGSSEETIVESNSGIFGWL